jgi:hypothetical protein
MSKKSSFHIIYLVASYSPVPHTPTACFGKKYVYRSFPPSRGSRGQQAETGNLSVEQAEDRRGEPVPLGLGYGKYEGGLGMLVVKRNGRGG